MRSPCVLRLTLPVFSAWLLAIQQQVAVALADLPSSDDTEDGTPIPKPSDFDCDLCGGPQRWVFIVGTPRSGTTSAMNMLDSLPGFHISGENNGMMSNLRMIAESVHSMHQRSGVPMGSWAHVGRISTRRLHCSMQAMVSEMLGHYSPDETKVLGFKEVRHTPEDLDFFLSVFPCAQFVIVTRGNLSAQELSIREHFPSETDVGAAVSLRSLNEDDLRNQSLGLRHWAASHRSQSYPILLEHFTVDTFNDLLRWLGVSGCAYTSVSHANSHKHNGFGLTHARPNMTGRCIVSS
mmetsp:Transcript_43592/g.102763  ORF Transcript_43592/g.102763 Transcript_43592/m.102763 type:complete len:293 (-) Transcript_43592:155-1033(-)